MAVHRITGRHVLTEGSPSAFRTEFGAILSNPDVESLFSRKGETANLDAVRQQHSEVVAEFDMQKNSSIHITNNEPFIVRLNDGWSAQTPAGFFERGTEEARKVLRGGVRLTV